MWKYQYVLEAIFVTCTDMILPTFDTVSDLSLVINIAFEVHDGQEEVYGSLWILAMLLPIILNIGFTLYIWRDSNLDDDNEKKWTWVLVIFSLWPQYQAYKLVKRIFKAQRSGIYCDKEDLKRQGQVGSLEGYCESLPQFLILTVLAIYKGGLIPCYMGEIPMIYMSNQTSSYEDVKCGEGNITTKMTEIEMYKLLGRENTIIPGVLYTPQYYWFTFSYQLTIISCTFAILRFIDYGPVRILQRRGWRNIVGYGAAFVSVIVSLYTKAQGLGTGGYVMYMFYKLFGNEDLIHEQDKLPVNMAATVYSGYSSFRFDIIIVWMSINLLPQLVFAFWNLTAVVGTKLKDIRNIVFKYPQLILCPTFSFYTFGGIDTNHWCYNCNGSTGTDKISISKYFTIVNAVISTIPSMILWILILAFANPADEITSNGFLGAWKYKLPKVSHVFVSHMIPIVLSYFCTYLSINLDGKVGVLDTSNLFGIFVKKKGVAKVREISAEEVYEMNKEDPDRIFYDLDVDNEVIDDNVDFRRVRISNDSSTLRAKVQGINI